MKTISDLILLMRLLVLSSANELKCTLEDVCFLFMLLSFAVVVHVRHICSKFRIVACIGIMELSHAIATHRKKALAKIHKKKQRKKCLMKLYLLRAEYATQTNPCVCVFRVHTNGLVSRHVMSHISYNVRKPFINLWQKRFGATAQLLVNEFQIEEQITLYSLQSSRLYGTVALVEAFTPAAQTTMTTM